MDNTTLSHQLFHSLGLDSLEAKVMLHLLKSEPETILQISRQTRIPRTQVYRIMEKVEAKGLVTEQLDENRKLYKAASLDTLENLVRQEEIRLQLLQSTFANLKPFLAQKEVQGQGDTKVYFYKGRTGLREMAWHLTKAKSPVFGFTSGIFETAVGNKFAQEIYQEMGLQSIKFRELFSDLYLSEIKKQKRLPHHFKNQSENLQSRYLPPDVLDIQIQMDIYDEVVSIYNWHEGEVFGVEIHNPQLAKLQKQLFKVLWEIGQKVEELNLTK